MSDERSAVAQAIIEMFRQLEECERAEVIEALRCDFVGEFDDPNRQQWDDD